MKIKDREIHNFIRDLINETSFGVGTCPICKEPNIGLTPKMNKKYVLNLECEDCGYKIKNAWRIK